MAPTSIEPQVVNKQELIHMPLQVVDLFVTLSSGARLLMVSHDIKLAPHMLVPLLVQERVTVLQATPSFLHMYGARTLATVRHLQHSNYFPLGLAG
jgi:non-ribosomal peptide synthetase component F